MIFLELFTKKELLTKNRTLQAKTMSGLSIIDFLRTDNLVNSSKPKTSKIRLIKAVRKIKNKKTIGGGGDQEGYIRLYPNGKYVFSIPPLKL